MQNPPQLIKISANPGVSWNPQAPCPDPMEYLDALSFTGPAPPAGGSGVAVRALSATVPSAAAEELWNVLLGGGETQTEAGQNDHFGMFG